MSEQKSIWPNWQEERPYGALVLGALFMAFLFLLTGVLTNLQSLQYIGQAPKMPDTITIEGQGKVTSVPDIATIDLGVLTSNIKVAEAQQENVKKMNNLTNRLKQIGIEEKDMKTAQYTIYPRYDYTAGRSEIVAYDVQQTLNVKIRDLTKLSTVLQAAAEVESNQIGGLNFTVDEPEDLKVEARLKALKNAREKAEALASALGVKLGKIVSFSESSGDSMNPVPYAYAREGLGGGGAAPDIQQGSLDIVSNVTVSYELR